MKFWQFLTLVFNSRFGRFWQKLTSPNSQQNFSDFC
jgi:hypothetical protein